MNDNVCFVHFFEWRRFAFCSSYLVLRLMFIGYAGLVCHHSSYLLYNCVSDLVCFNCWAVLIYVQ